MTATGLTWFAGNLTPLALFWHRGPLTHRILVHAAAVPRSRPVIIGIVIGYAAATLPLWRSDLATVLLAVSLVALALRERHTLPPGAGRQISAAWYAAVALSTVLVAGVAVRMLGPAQSTAVPVLWAYESVLTGIA